MKLDRSDLKRGDKIKFHGRVGTLLTDAKYETNKVHGFSASGLDYADIQWEDGQIQRDFMLNRVGLTGYAKEVDVYEVHVSKDTKEAFNKVARDGDINFLSDPKSPQAQIMCELFEGSSDFPNISTEAIMKSWNLNRDNAKGLLEKMKTSGLLKESSANEWQITDYGREIFDIAQPTIRGWERQTRNLAGQTPQSSPNLVELKSYACCSRCWKEYNAGDKVLKIGEYLYCPKCGGWVH